MPRAGGAYGFSSFLIFFTKKLRLSNPWNYKVPFLICVPYLQFLISGYTGAYAFLSVLFSLIIIIGVAGIGYLSNDLGDKDKDRLIGKENVTSGLSITAIIALFVSFILLTTLPWIWLPFNKISIVLLVTQLALFFIYALPPFRLKEKGLAGIICDTLYAHLLPTLLASFTFFLFKKSDFSEYMVYLILLGTWQFLVGLRNILFHQIKDHEDDLKSGTKTFVTNSGLVPSEKLVKLVLKLELATFVLFTLYLLRFSYFLFPSAILFWLFTYLKKESPLQATNYRTLAYNYLDDLYIRWFPLFVLVVLCFNSTNFLPVLALHFLIFRSDIKTLLNKQLQSSQ